MINDLLRSCARRFFKTRRSQTVQFRSLIRDTSLAPFVYIGPECRIFQTQIEAFASIGPRVIIGEAEHITEHIFLSNALLSEKERGAYDLNKARPTVIGMDCWIGAGAIIRKGVRIGRGAVIGAGAVVVHDVEPYAIMGGVPARLIRMRFDDAQREALEASRWWTLDPEVLRKRHLENSFASMVADRK